MIHDLRNPGPLNQNSLVCYSHLAEQGVTGSLIRESNLARYPDYLAEQKIVQKIYAYKMNWSESQSNSGGEERESICVWYLINFGVAVSALSP